MRCTARTRVLRWLVCWQLLIGAGLAAQTSWPPVGYDKDWATYQNDFQRTGRSLSGLRDVSCQLTLLWSHTDPYHGCYYAGPIIKDGRVVQAFEDRYRIFDLATGAILHEIVTGGDEIYCTPTIASVRILDDAFADVLFLAGGTNGRVLAYLWNDIAAGPLWVWDAPGDGQTVRYGGFVVLNMAGTDVLYFEANQNRIYAVNAADGLDYAGWGGTPWQALGFGGTHTYLTSDGGSLLFVAEAPAGFPGDIYAIDAYDKSEVWKFSEEGGLQAGAIFGIGFNDEGFRGPVSVGFSSVPTVYANSSVTGAYPVDGVFYRIDMSNGNLISAESGNRAMNGAPIVDDNLVYVPTYSRWAEPPAGGDMIAYRTSDGAEQWADKSPGTRYLLNGLVTSEQTGTPDKVVAVDESGRLHLYDAETGQEIMYRRLLDDGSLADGHNGGSVAMVQDTLVVTSWNGSVHVLAITGIDRPRLDIQKQKLFARIPVGNNPDTLITFPDVFRNGGCAPLEVQLVADLSSNGTLDELTAALQSDCKAGTTPKNSGVMPEVGVQREAEDISAARLARSTAAGVSGAPPYLAVSAWSEVANAGEFRDLGIRVNTSLLTRGEYTFYVQLASNDSDYFLNHPELAPEVEVKFVYGCLDDTTTLHFGYGGGESQLVTNSGRLGTGWWHEGPSGCNGFMFEGEGEEYYQGGLLYGVSQRRLAMNTPDWSAYTPADCNGGVYRSLLPDPNRIDGDCKPAIRDDIALPDFTLDGFTYLPFTASAVHATWIDSVQLFTDQNGTWDWSLVSDPFNGDYSSDSTIGLLTNSVTIGLRDVPGAQHLEYLNHGTLQLLELINRTDQTIEGLSLAHFLDTDFGRDTVQINRSISTAWTYGLYGLDVFGTVKIPYGYGHEPLCNIRGMQSYDGFWGYGSYFDSAYSYMQAVSDVPLGGPTTELDGQAHITLANNITILPHDTIRLALVHFRIQTLSDPGDPDEPKIHDLSATFNKLAGFSRGDVNNDGKANLSDLIVLANYLFRGGPGPIPFRHLGDLNADGLINMTDVQYMINYYFFFGPAPSGAWEVQVN